jgi:HK97 family phage portal protein
MGLFDRFRRTQNYTTTTFGVSGTAYGDGGYWGTDTWLLSDAEYDRIMGLSPSEMWRTQPYLRTVVTFLARNIAQLGVHAFQRAGEDNRLRVRDGVAEVLARPNTTSTTYELIYGLVADLALYDRAYWLMSPEPSLVRLPVPWVTPQGGDLQAPDRYVVKADDRGNTVTIPATEVLAFHGWDPTGLRSGSSPVAALKEILAEQVQAARYRQNVWKRGGKVGAVLTRPPDAPEWSDEARKQFKHDWEARFTGNGPGVGGTPLLEDGMSLSRVDFSAHEMQFIEGSRLALNTVASVYHVNPTMIGLLDNANYSNVREFRRMLYGDTLGPLLAQIEDRLNAFLVPRYDSRPGIYVEFNIEEKLQGNFEEQTAALQSSVGRPWMTANEARALRNMPAIDGGDDLVTPLNVLVGGQSSPRDGETAGGGGGLTADDIKQRVDAAAALIRSGFNPTGALEAVGLDPIEHLGLLPVTVQRPAEPEAVDQEAVDDLKSRGLAELDTKQGRLFLLKARITDRQADQITFVLRRFFARQRDADPTGAKWDEDRWNRELAEDLYRVALSVTETLGRAEAQALGFSEDDYDPEATVNFLQAVAERRARNINLTTKTQLDAAQEAEDGDPAEVYAEAVETRAPGIAVGVATFLASFATQEAAAQIARTHDVEPTKTWVTGHNPRTEHAQLDGETVPLDEPFSNGLMWPGDAQGDVDDVAGCNCALQINLV